jgi:hypothetical protein
MLIFHNELSIKIAVTPASSESLIPYSASSIMQVDINVVLHYH